jgi:hypothetical protein
MNGKGKEWNGTEPMKGREWKGKGVEGKEKRIMDWHKRMGGGLVWFSFFFFWFVRHVLVCVRCADQRKEGIPSFK